METRFVNRLVKRIIDITGSIIGLIVFVPVILFVVVQIKMEDGGSIIYKQMRVGKKGKTFMMLKFRSMVENAHEMKNTLLQQNEATGPMFKMKDDPRVTNIGKLMRTHSFDEIPQFINVLRGEMTLVGPRPALPEEVSAYSVSDSKRLNVTPGLTGLWQVSGRSDLSYSQMINLDLEYVEKQSIGFDLKILFKTFIQMVTPGNSGAY